MSLIPIQKLPPRRRTEDARGYAYRAIRHSIMTLQLLPGQKMNETDLANALDVSRTPVHDTLTRLSRECLVDIIPQKGAFVSRIDARRIEQAVWIHTHLGTAILQSIYIKDVKKPQLDVLYYGLRQLDGCLAQGDLSQSVRLITGYYQQLYDLAGGMDHVWSSVQTADTDLRRLLYLSASNPTVAEGFLCELTSLTDALASRDNDHACAIYRQHLSRILMLIPPLSQRHPDYFLECQGGAR